MTVWVQEPKSKIDLRVQWSNHPRLGNQPSLTHPNRGHKFNSGMIQASKAWTLVVFDCLDPLRPENLEDWDGLSLLSLGSLGLSGKDLSTLFDIWTFDPGACGDPLARDGHPHVEAGNIGSPLLSSPASLPVCGVPEALQRPLRVKEEIRPNM